MNTSEIPASSSVPESAPQSESASVPESTPTPESESKPVFGATPAPDHMSVSAPSPDVSVVSIPAPSFDSTPKSVFVSTPPTFSTGIHASAQYTEAHFSSPLPSSEELKRLRDIDHSIPERLIRMVEKEQQNRFENDKRRFELQKEDSRRADEELKTNKWLSFVSIIISFFIVCLFIGAVVFLAGYFHAYGAASALGIGGVATIVGYIIFGARIKMSSMFKSDINDLTIEVEKDSSRETSHTSRKK